LKKQQALLVDELCQAHHPLQFVGCPSPTGSLVPSQELVSQTALMIMDPITSHTVKTDLYIMVPLNAGKEKAFIQSSSPDH
jgi:hypothetical protein